MRKASWTVCAAALVAAIASMPALAIDPPPLPTVPTVTVPTPPAPPPLPPAPTPPRVVPVPKPKPPPAPAPVAPKITRATKPAAPAPARSSGGGGTSAPAAAPPSTGSAPAQSSVTHGSAARPAPQARASAPASRGWVPAGGKRATTIVVTVPAAGTLELRVSQLWPVCRSAGRIVVHAHRGRNAILLRGRIAGRRLAAGTYRITPRLRGRRALRAIVVVVSAARPASGALAAARRANACATRAAAASSTELASSSFEAGSSSGSGKTAPAPANRDGAHALASARPQPRDKDRGGILGAQFTKPLRDPTSVNPLVLLVLAIAIGLLALAATPRSIVTSPALAEQLTNRRLELALAGTVTLFVVVVAYLLLV